MNTTLLVTLDGTTYEQLDIFEDIPISLVIQQSDLLDLVGRKVPYSKTLVLPDTISNSVIFENYYEVNGTDFNPLSKLQCVVQYRGTDIFSGLLRLNSVTETINGRNWEIFLLGQVGDFSSDIRNYTLQQLSYDDLIHELSYDNILLSWDAKSNTNDGLLGGDIIYPLINYGLDYQGSSTTPTFSFDFVSGTSFSLSGNSVPITYFKPAIRIKKVLEKIFDLTSYELQSDFFDTDYFKSIYMDTFTNGRLGIVTPEDVANENIFRTFTNPFLTYFFGNFGSRKLNFNTLGLKGYDPLGNFTLGPSTNNTNTGADFDGGFFRVPYTGLYNWNLRFGYDGTGNPGLNTLGFRIRGRKGTDPDTLSLAPVFFVSDLFTVGSSTDVPDVDLYFSGSCTTGEYVGLFIDVTMVSIFAGDGTNNFVNIKPFTTNVLSEPAPMWELYNSPSLTGTDLVDIKLGIQNMNAMEFIKGLITTFNLLIYQDENSGTIRMEPYNWFYNDSERTQRDWTGLVDRNSDSKIQPLSFELSKELVWTNQKPDEDFLNFTFFQQNNFVYGRERFVSSNNIFSGEQVYETPFASVPTNALLGAPNFIIPEFYFLNNGLQAPYQTPPHMFFWVGNRFCYTDKLQQIQSEWYMTSGFTPQALRTYPCVSHLSSLDIQISDLVSDLNYRSTLDFFFSVNNQPVQFTPFNLYNLFWDDYVENIYSPETRRLTCRVFLTPIDIYDTSLRDKIWIKDANYTIEKINEADLVNKKITEVFLIKERTPYYKVIPPPPIQGIQPNQSYPVPGLFNDQSCFIGSQTDVCNGTADIETIKILGGTGGLDNFLKVYSSTGFSLVLVPMGTYLRQTTSSTTFVVVDIYGRILETNC